MSIRVRSVFTGRLAAGPRRGRRAAPSLLVTLCLAAGLVTEARAHLVFPLQIHFRDKGETTTVDVVDCCGCSAEIGATVDDPSVATVSPVQGSGTAVRFVVTSQTGERASTSLRITVKGFGVGDFGQECNEDSENTYPIEVKAPARTTAQIVVSGSTADPVNVFSGELFELLEPDLVIPGSKPLFFQRYHASGLARDGGHASALGPNWLHNFDIVLREQETFVEVLFEMGRVIRFSLVEQTSPGIGAYELISPLDIPYRLTRSGNFNLTDPSTNHVYEFDELGRLSMIKDEHGVETVLNYSSTRLARIVEGGRSLELEYESGKLARVVSDDARGVSFAYTGDNLTAFTDVRGETTLYEYDPSDPAAALLVRTTRPEGNVPWSQTYDAGNRVSSQTDSAGNALAITYEEGATGTTDALEHRRSWAHGENGELIELVDETGRSAAFEYDDHGRRRLLSDRMGNTLAYTFHPDSGRIAKLTNPDGGRAEFTYSQRAEGAAGRFDLEEVVYPDGTSERFSHDTGGNLVSRTDRAGTEWQRTYDEHGQILSATTPEGAMRKYAWNPDRTLSSMEDPRGNVTTLDYDGHRQPTTVTFADSTTLEFGYDDAGNFLRSVDERGGVTSYVHDRSGNLISLTDPLGSTTEMRYDGQDRIDSVTDPLGQVRSFSYDELGRVSRVQDRADHVVSFGYDAPGRLVSATDGEGNVYRRTWDAEGILAAETDPLGNSTMFASDSMGRVTERTTPRGSATTYRYDLMGRLVRSEDASGRAASFEYDTLGRLSELAIGGVVASYERNALGQVTVITDPNGERWELVRDAQGRFIAETDPLSRTTSYEYDERNRIAKVTYPDDLGTLSLTRDAAGAVTRLLYSDGVDLQFEYDARGRLTGGERLSLAYDANGSLVESNGLTATRTPTGQLASVTFAEGKTVVYTYDRRDLVVSVTDWNGNAIEIEYDAARRPTRVARPNGVVTTYDYDADGNVVEIVDEGIASITLARDELGRVSAATRRLPAVPAALPSSLEVTYDAASQDSALEYDASGRLLRDDRRVYTWNLASRLERYEDESGVVSFEYDGVGVRTARIRAGVREEYTWNYALGLPGISAIRENGSDRSYYVHLPSGQLLSSIDARDGSTLFYHFDERGNTTFLSDAAGDVAASYSCSPYGLELASPDATGNPFTFMGAFGVVRESAGLYYARARYYDADSARFLSRDSVRSVVPHRINPYQYAIGSPLEYVDPVGAQEGTAPDWANKSGAVGLGFNTTMGGTNGITFRTYVSPLFGHQGTLGFQITSADIDPSTADNDEFTVSNTMFSVGLYGTYKIAYWQRGSLAILFGGDVQSVSTSIDAFGSDNDTETSTTNVILGLGLQAEWFPVQYLSLYLQGGLRLDFLGNDDFAALSEGPVSLTPLPAGLPSPLREVLRSKRQRFLSRTPRSSAALSGGATGVDPEVSGMDVAFGADLLGAAGVVVWFK